MNSDSSNYHRQNHRSIAIGGALLILLAIAIVLTVVFATGHSHAAKTNGSAGRPYPVAYTKPRIWYVTIGTQNHNTIEGRNVTLNGLSFYPSIITIDAGDAITWTVDTKAPQTVRFLNNDPPPPSSSVAAEAPLGGHTCCTLGAPVSSGLLAAHHTYSMTFTTPGVYDYISDTTEGMQGVVDVRNKGASYPESQGYLDRLASGEELADIAVARQIERSHINEIKALQHKVNGSTQSSIHAQMEARVVLSPSGGSAAEGIAKVSVSSQSINVSADVYRLQPSMKYILAIKGGLCAMPSNANTLSASGSVGASGSGYAHLAIGDTTITNQPGIPEAGWLIAVEDASNNSIVACGNISYHNVEIEY